MQRSIKKIRPRGTWTKDENKIKTALENMLTEFERYVTRSITSDGEG